MLLTTLILNLASNSITLRTDKSICYSRIVIICLIISSLLSYVSFYSNLLGTGIGIYGGLFFISSITNIFHIFIYILTSVILIFTGFYAKKFINNDDSINTIFLSKKKYYHIKILNIKSEIYKILEYPLIILFILNGALFLICANDLVSIFISIELQSYGLYLISSIHKNSESSTAGGLMYFLLGGLSSCFILLGTSLLYSNSGTTNLDNLYIINNISNFVYLPLDNSKYLENYIYSFSNVSTYSNYYIIISLVIMGVGLLFKVSAAPFHFWSPDVYDAIPTIVTSFVAIIAKISIFILLLELVHYLSKSSINYVWTNNLLISSLLSLIIGSVLGLTQFRIKRLYAYSTISHIGFILLALSINTLESIQAFMFYLIQYSISNLNAFIILISIGYLYYNSDLNDNVNNTINNKNEEEININNTVNKDDNHEENINIKNKEDNDKLEEYFDDIAHGTYKQKDEMVRYHVRRLKRSLGWEIHEKDKYGYNEKNNNEKDNNKKDNNEKGNLVNSNEKNNPVDNKEKNNITDKNQKDNLLSYTFDDTNEKDNLLEKENSPIQVISQLNGYFNSNPLLTLSLSITLFSFAGIPPLIGFFGKMMVLSAAIDIGYIFMALVAILTSVISAVYYLFIIKESYFNNTSFISENNVKNTNYVVLSNYLSISISILTLFILLFILFPDQLINITSILVLILFNV